MAERKVVDEPWIVRTRIADDGVKEYLVYVRCSDMWGDTVYLPSKIHPLTSYEVDTLINALGSVRDYETQ